jgi:hypothetical protein
LDKILVPGRPHHPTVHGYVHFFFNIAIFTVPVT